MKIKKYMALALMCLPLCGCSEEGLTNYTSREDYAGWTTDEEMKKTIQEYNDLFQISAKTPRLSKKAAECLDRDFERFDGINHIQHSNGREVKCYESKKIKGYYVLYDGEWSTTLEPAYAIPENCKALFDRLSENALVAREAPVTRNGVCIIRCDNREYSLTDFESMTMFSIQYPDVDVETENCPVRALVFCRSGKPFRVEINTPVAEGLGKINDTNKEQVRELLDTLGFGDKSEEIAQEYTESLDKKDYVRKDGTITIRNTKNVTRQREVVYNVFTVDFD